MLQVFRFLQLIDPWIATISIGFGAALAVGTPLWARRGYLRARDRSGAKRIWVRYAIVYELAASALIAIGPTVFDVPFTIKVLLSAVSNICLFSSLFLLLSTKRLEERMT